jgi:hypothetical protein
MAGTAPALQECFTVNHQAVKVGGLLTCMMLSVLQIYIPHSDIAGQHSLLIRDLVHSESSAGNEFLSVIASFCLIMAGVLLVTCLNCIALSVITYIVMVCSEKTLYTYTTCHIKFLPTACLLDLME